VITFPGNWEYLYTPEPYPFSSRVDTLADQGRSLLRASALESLSPNFRILHEVCYRESHQIGSSTARRMPVTGMKLERDIFMGPSAGRSKAGMASFTRVTALNYKGKTNGSKPVPLGCIWQREQTGSNWPDYMLGASLVG
jgi:hypothetical protein